MQQSNLNNYNSILEGYREPTIVKAEFILSPTRIYNLEFDHNITMDE